MPEQHQQQSSPARVVGRDRERESILQIASARTTRGTVLITGEPGSGKTTLLRDVAESLDGWLVLRAQADAFETDLSFATVDMLMSGLRRGGWSPGRNADQHEEHVAGRALLDALDSAGRPVCIVIDDLQWVDSASEQALRFVLRRLDGHPALIVAASRSAHSELAQLLQSFVVTSPAHSIHIDLEPFAARDTQELAVALIGQHISHRTAVQLTEASSGSPLLLTMLLTRAKESLAQALHPAGVEIAAPVLNPLSSTVMNTLESVSPAARSAAEIAAVLRTPVPVALFGTIVGLLGDDVDADGARAGGFIQLYEQDRVTMLEPKHALLADAVVTHISLERRRAIHQAAAQVMTGHRALLHRVEASEQSDPELVAALVEASRDAADHGRTEQAMSYARSAVRLAPSGWAHESALINIGLLALRMLAHQRIFDLKPAIAGLRPSAVRDVIMLELSTLTGDLPDAFRRAEDILHDRGDDPDTSVVKAHAACAVPKVQMATGSFGPVIAQVETARDVLAHAPVDPADVVDPALRWMVQPSDNLIRVLGWKVSAAARIADGALLMQTMAELDALLAQAADSAAVIDSLVVQARVRIQMGDLLRVRDDLARANSLIRRFPTAWTGGYARTIYAHVLFLLGEWDASLSVADTAVTLALDEPDLSGWPVALAVSTLVRAARGKTRSVLDRLEKIAGAPHAAARAYDPDLPTIARAELARAMGDPTGQLAATAGRTAADASGSTLGWLTYRIDALAALGRPIEARAELAGCSAAGSRWTPAYGSLDWLEGRVAEAEGDLNGALENYTRACTAAVLYPFPRAIAELDRARMLRQKGSLHDAAAAIGRAAATFRRVGAAPYLERCNTELALMQEASRASLRSVSESEPHVDPFASLTTRERQVAHAISTGLTNREVADQLYVSVTTVNFHVRNILAKLGVSSRRDLRRMAAPAGPVKN